MGSSWKVAHSGDAKPSKTNLGAERVEQAVQGLKVRALQTRVNLGRGVAKAADNAVAGAGELHNIRLALLGHDVDDRGAGGGGSLARARLERDALHRKANVLDRRQRLGIRVAQLGSSAAAGHCRCNASFRLLVG